MKAGALIIQNPDQTLGAVKRIRTRIDRNMALQPDHSTIGTLTSGLIYETLTGRLLKLFPNPLKPPPNTQ